MQFGDYIKKYNEYKKQRESSGFRTIKVAILRSYSCELLEKIIGVMAFEKGFNTEFFMGGFNQYLLEILNQGGELYKFSPDIVLIAVNAEDFEPRLLDCGINISPFTKAEAAKVVNRFRYMLLSLTSRYKGRVFVTNFAKPYFAPVSSYDSGLKNGLANSIRRLNNLLLEKCTDFENVHFIDIEELIGNIGREAAYDLKMRHIAKNPYSFPLYEGLSHRFVNMLSSLYGKRKKCIVLDLDNSLWKGVIGEEGLEGIEINEGFKNFQRQLLFLNNSGILLAINSKNNEAEAIEAIEKHPDMVLRRNNFSSIRINWQDKASNLREIASELNLGLESFIFIDDSRFECEFVAQALPQVTVVNLDGNYLGYADIAKKLPDTDFISLTDEDRERTSLYKSQAGRSRLMESSASLEDYLEQLNISAAVKPLDNFSLKRAAQLTQKTNQFNLTTRRYTEAQLEEMRQSHYGIYTLYDKDSFGDNGLTGLIIVDKSRKEGWLIDTFLLSCRVMGRNLEYAFMYYIIEEAKKENVTEILGLYIETEKNKPVKDLYGKMGFVFTLFPEESEGFWVFETERPFAKPSYIKIN